MPSLTLSITYSAEECDALREAAFASSPDVQRWGEYPAPMREQWRKAFGHGWAAQLAKPLAQLAPLDMPEAAPQGPIDRPADPDRRPPDPIPVRPLAPAGAKARLRAVGTLAPSVLAALPLRAPKGGGFLNSL